MSWHVDVIGTKEEVLETLDIASASSSPPPPALVAYAKEAVAATNGGEQRLVRLTTNGHRPMEYGMANEQVKIELVSTIAGYKPTK